MIIPHADLVQHPLGNVGGLRGGFAEHVERPGHDVVQDVQVRKEIELLKDHADPTAQQLRLALFVPGRNVPLGMTFADDGAAQ